MRTADEPTWQVVPRAGYQINSTAISAHGERCVLGTSNEFDSGDFAVFCYDQDGQLQWSDAIGTDMYQGVFWVAISHDARYAAAGGASKKQGDQRGFLTAYRVDDGTRLLDEQLTGRVNEVEISADGRLIAAVNEDQVQLYVRGEDGYYLSDSKTLANQFCISCGIASEGNRVVVGSYRNYSSSEGPSGMVQAFDVIDDKLQPLGNPSTQLGKILRVAIVYDGSWWGASTHAGQCAVFRDQSSDHGATPVWTYQLPDRDLSVAYAFAISKNDEEQVFAACGVNLGGGVGHGCVFALESILTADGYSPKLLWANELDYDPNPGVNMDGECRYITATDGQPYSTEQKRAPNAADKTQASESPGNFYLFDRQSGEKIWQYRTSLMNWPMAISRAGNAIFAASDNGTAYYWKG